MSDRANLRVVKVGGSLLASPELGQRIKDWLGQQPASPTVWVVGGGGLVDVVRDWQATYCSPGTMDVEAHWMSVDLMSVTAKMFAMLVGGWPIEHSLESLWQRIDDRSQDVIFDCRTWLSAVDDLPCSWSVTSDSIAGRLAIELACRELVLLKSCDADGETVAQNVTQGVIDAYFSNLDLECRVTLVNLNDGGPKNSFVLV